MYVYMDMDAMCVRDRRHPGRFTRAHYNDHKHRLPLSLSHARILNITAS